MAKKKTSKVKSTPKQQITDADLKEIFDEAVNKFRTTMEKLSD